MTEEQSDPVEQEEIKGEEIVQDAVEQEDTGEGVQEAAEQNSEVDSNWVQARDTMKQQKETIDNQSTLLNALKKELDDFKVSSAPKEQKASTDLFDGRDNYDLITVADIRKAFSEQQSVWQSAYTELSAKSKYSDMDDVINKYGKNLPHSVKYAVVNSNNPHLAAYEACTSSAAYYKDQMSNETSRAAQKAERNLKKPGSASSVGNAGALSKATYYESLDDAKLLAESENYIFGR